VSELFTALPDGLLCRMNRETLFIQAWGSGLRVRATMASDFRDDALSALLPNGEQPAEVIIQGRNASVTRAGLRCEVAVAYPHGRPREELQLRFVEASSGRELLAEQRGHFQWPGPRHYTAHAHQSWRIEATFKPAPDERLYGMGQRQHGLLDQKGCVLELLQRNGEVNIPWVISSRGYGYLWNSPAIGRAEFGNTLTRWVAEAAHQIDYWVATGNPAELLDRYAEATGRAPAFPAWASGFWQSKLRYHNQAQLLSVAHEHRRRGLPLACIVIDFFHWTRQGEWRFDPADWPDPAGMVAELRGMGVEVMVSIWPTVNPDADTWEQMDQAGWLVETARGLPLIKPFIDTDTGPTKMVAMHFYDPTHPGARAFVFEQARRNYLALGIKGYWLDACEPAIMPVHPESLRLHLGTGAEVINAYPLFHTRAFFEGLQGAGEAEGMLLVRSAWAGSQRYGCLLWSGDIRSTFASLRAQVCAGLNAGLSGIGWWTTDIGGFYDGNGNDPMFRELLVRWFQWAVFCPVTRLHGYRVNNDVAQRDPDPDKPYGEDEELDPKITGGDNEVWCWGEQVEGILRHCLLTRERLRPYVMRLMAEFSATGAPPMRPLFFDFPDDPAAWGVDDQHMFGPDLLIAPVLEFGARSRSVRLPAGSRWTEVWSGRSLEGGQVVEVDAPLERIPVFAREGAAMHAFGD
jgi:alpha-D-xyloside xylohydrolase